MGKEQHLLAWIDFCRLSRENLDPESSGIVHVIPRAEIESTNLGRMLEHFGPHIAKTELRRVRGRIHFAISGYEEVPEEIYEIPQIRQFFSLMHAVWPAWLYVASTASPSLMAIAFGICQNLAVTRTPNSLAVEVPTVDMLAFFVSSLPATLLLNHITDVAEDVGMKQLKAVADYLSVDF